MFGVEYEVFVAVLDNKDHHLYKQYKEWRQASKALTFGILQWRLWAGKPTENNVNSVKPKQLK